MTLLPSRAQTAALAVARLAEQDSKGSGSLTTVAPVVENVSGGSGGASSLGSWMGSGAATGAGGSTDFGGAYSPLNVFFLFCCCSVSALSFLLKSFCSIVTLVSAIDKDSEVLLVVLMSFVTDRTQLGSVGDGLGVLLLVGGHSRSRRVF